MRENLHPDFPKRGERLIPVDTNEIYISREDSEKYNGKVVRLIGMFNVELGQKVRYHGDELIQDMPKLQWVSEENMPIKIVMDDGKIIEGLAEPDVGKLSEDDIIQFMRFGFCRLDNKREMKFYFTHK